MVGDIIKFEAKIVKSIWNKSDFKVYAVSSDKKEVKRNQYGNTTVSGDIPELTIGSKYQFIGIEQQTKYGVGYKVKNVKKEKPMDVKSSKIFLSEILTQKQADTLLNAYPNIIDLIMKEEDKIDLSKLKGIGEFTFNKIKTKIIENFCLADFVSEFDGLFSISIAKKLYDKYSSIEMMKQRLAEEPYKSLCEISGIGFKKADSILLEIDKNSKKKIKHGEIPIFQFDFDLRSSEERCLAYILYALSENEKNGNTKMNLANLRSECLKEVPETIEHFASAIKSDAIFYEKETMSISRSITYQTEQFIANCILSAIESGCIKWNVDLEKYKHFENFQLTDEQMESIKMLCTYPISILNGGAGVGKTYCTKTMVQIIKDKKKNFLLLSPTGKAAKKLSEYTHESAMTIHRGLGYRPPDNWEYNKDNKLYYDVIIIDEFSMVDIWMFKRVLEAVDFSRTRILLIGDDAQLPSIGAGNILYDFMRSGMIPVTTLTKIFRYGEGGLMKIADDIRKTIPYLNKENAGKLTAFGTNQDYIFIDSVSDKIPTKVVQLYKKFLNEGYNITDIQVLTAKNVGGCGSIFLNQEIQKVANKNYGSLNKLTIGEISYYVNDIVIQKVNNYKANIAYTEQQCLIANGETGTIKKIEGNTVYIDFDGVLICYTKEEMNTIGLGYAISIHKSQGSGFKIVILCSPKTDIFMMNSNLLYVGVTRTQQKCYHIGSIGAINATIKKKENFDRDTHLKNMLTNKKTEDFLSQN